MSCPEVRRKIVNRIEDSESDSDCPSKSHASGSDNDGGVKEREKKLHCLIELYPSIAITVIKIDFKLS